jgi:hypothetical protein
MYKGLVAKSVTVEPRVILEDTDSDDVKIQKLSEENTELKKLVTANKPPPVPKAEKVVQPPAPKKEKKKENEDEDEEEDEPDYFEKKEPIKPILKSTEALKISFFAGDYEAFKTQVIAKNENDEHMLFFEANYKYNSDKDGVQAFNAKNLVNHLVKNFKEQHKLFMCCFRCYQNPTDPVTYEYKAWWIMNTLKPLKEVVGDIVDDFNVVTLTDSVKINEMLTVMEKVPRTDEGELTNGCIVEEYVH